MEYKTSDATKVGLDVMKMQPLVDVEWVRTIPITDGMKVLDVGCFKGRDIRQLWADYPNCQLFAVDILQPAIDFCKENHADTGATFLCCDAVKLPFKDKEFDVVYENGMIADNTDPREIKAIKAEMERVGKAVYYS